MEEGRCAGRSTMIPYRHYFLLVLLMFSSATLAAELDIRIKGIDGELRDNALALLSLSQLQEEGAPPVTEFRVRQYFAKARDEIRTALEPFGYYHPEIQAALDLQEQTWIARFDISPGAPVRVHEMDVQLLGEGEGEPRLRQEIAGADLQRGEIAEHSRYEAFKKSLQSRALELGYLDAEYVRHQLRIDPRTNQARVVLHLQTGPRYRFGEVSFSGGGLNQDLLHKYVPFDPGDPYAARQLLELQRALLDSDYFRSVSVSGDREAARERRIPVKVELEPRKRQKYTAGIGFGTDTGARVRLGWEHRRINKRGHRLSAEVKASQIYTGADLIYSLPVRNPRTDRLSFTAAALQEDTDTAESTSGSLSVNLVRARGRLRENLALRYLDEEFEIGTQEGRSTLLMPGVAWTHIKADNTLITERGRRLQLELRGAAEQVLSDTSFVQAIAAAKFIHPLGQRGRLLTRAEVGTTWTSGFEDLPASVRFFAGGDRSVRGFEFDSLGPTDSQGNVIGGRHLLVGSVEYEHKIKGKWRGAVFVDAGNAVDAFGDELETGVGVGVRWVSPIGLLRVDLAAAVSEPGNPLRLHVTLGPDL